MVFVISFKIKQLFNITINALAVFAEEFVLKKKKMYFSFLEKHISEFLKSTLIEKSKSIRLERNHPRKLKKVQSQFSVGRKA